MATGDIITVKVTDRDGVCHEIQSRPAQDNIMQVLYDAGQDIEATCGGCASCATCHVYVADEWMTQMKDRDSDELMMLEGSEHFDPARSRLSCQIALDSLLDGLTMTLAPED